MIAVSKDAYAAAERAKLPRWYFDFARERKFQERNQTYTTPRSASCTRSRRGSG